MNCAISGEVPEEPVVSKKTGHVFEKRLIEKAVEQTGRCPVTGQDLTKDDLLPLLQSKPVRPRAPAVASIPGVLKVLQSEWDALMLETFTLKQALHTAREELSKVSYQHDAACRVIARLIKERDQAREALLDVKKNIAAGSYQAGAETRADDGRTSMEVEESGLSKAVLQVLTDTHTQLSQSRKKNVKAAVEQAATGEQISSFTLLASHTGMHGATKPGILCVDVNPRDDSVVATGGVDANVVILNRTSGKVEDTLKAHKKQVTSVKFHPTKDVVFSSSHDSSCLWTGADGKYKLAHTLKDHKGEVVGLTVHPSGNYLVTASTDGAWNFYDTASAALLTSVSDEKTRAGYTCVDFHPDGVYLGCGANDSVVHLFNVKQQKAVATFSEGHTAPISALAFSENGYYMASADTKGTVKVWDLRKASGDAQAIQTLTNSSAVNSVKFDASGSYLSVAALDITVYRTKSWDVVKTFSDHTAAVTAAQFGPRAGFIVSTSKDRSLKVFGSK